MNDDIDIVRGADLKNAAQPHNWIWDGLIGPQQLTLFTSVCKMGKTTLLAHLLAQRKNGGDFLGRAVRPGGSVVISEEPNALWEERNHALGFRPADAFICRPFAVAPSPERWQQLLDKVLALHHSDGIDLVLVDPLAHFLPIGAENFGPLLLETLLPLRRLTDAGLAVVLAHHPRKARAPAGLASRGSSLLPAFADIIMEMYPRTPGDVTDRQRRLLSFSRYPATPRVLLFELSADGLAFHVHQEPPPLDEFNESWRVLRMVLEDAAEALTRQEILAQWPTTFLAPKQATLWEWLDKAFERGLVRIDGTGRRADPFRYYLPEKLEEWKKDPLYEFRRLVDENAKKVSRLMGQRRE